MEQFRVLVSCVGVDYSYAGKQVLTLGRDIRSEVAADLLKAGHIVRIESEPEQPVVERTTVTPAEVAVVNPEAKSRPLRTAATKRDTVTKRTE